MGRKRKIARIKRVGGIKMAVHHFSCPECGIKIDDNTCKGIHKCPGCGSDMNWDCGNVGIAEGDYSHTSASLAINPCQTKAHKKLFPGVDVLSDGQIRFNSVKQQSDYCDKTGFDKVTQKIRQKGVRIG